MLTEKIGFYLEPKDSHIEGNIEKVKNTTLNSDATVELEPQAIHS